MFRRQIVYRSMLRHELYRRKQWHASKYEEFNSGHNACVGAQTQMETQTEDGVQEG